jgi:hypothetical protein
MAKKSEKRAIENDSAIQLNLFDNTRRKHPFEVLRMEIRLNKRQKIGQILRNLKLNDDTTFKSLFDANTAKLVLLYYLAEMEIKRPLLVNYRASNPEALLSDLVVNNPKLGPKRTLQLFGLKYALDNVNPRTLRGIFSNYGQRSWYRLMADANHVQLPVKENVFAVLHAHLNQFEPLKLVDFQDKMLNNDKYN